MYNYRHIFTNSVIMSYHGRIKNGYIAKFYLKEFLKFYNVDDLKKIKNWDDFVDLIHNTWRKKNNSNNEIVFRSGGYADVMYFSNNIYVASVYGGVLNAYILNFKSPYILDCKNSSWHNINKPEIMKEIPSDIVDTDSIVDFILKEKLNYDGIIFLNLYEGSGANVFGPSNVYVSLDKKTVVNLTNN